MENKTTFVLTMPNGKQIIFFVLGEENNNMLYNYLKSKNDVKVSKFNL